MNIIKESQEKYIAFQEAMNLIKNKITVREKQIERLKLRDNKLHEQSWWGDILIRPVMEEVKKKYPNLSWDDEKLTPMGLRCAVSIFADDNKGKTAVWLLFTPGNLNLGEIWYDTGVKKKEFAEGTIGYINGMNNLSVVLQSMDQLYKHIDNQIKK